MQEMPPTNWETFDTLFSFDFFVGEVEVIPLMLGQSEVQMQ